jgi:hypothetical protein
LTSGEFGHVLKMDCAASGNKRLRPVARRNSAKLTESSGAQNAGSCH